MQHHLEYYCKTKKYGTLLYRSGADLIQSLARALWQIRQSTKRELPTEPPPVPTTKMLEDLNELARSHINTYLKDINKDDFDMSSIDIDHHLQKVNPKLWEAICMLTKSASNESKLSALTKHTKKVRRFLILCAMLFCINDNYTLPLHTLISDTVDGQGGSALLMKSTESYWCVLICGHPC